MLEEKVALEQAEKEVGHWLDRKRITARKRMSDGYKQAIETLVDAVTLGDISINEDGTISHQLIVPLEGFADRLDYKARILTDDVNKIVKGLSRNDGKGLSEKDGTDRVIATISALTSQSVGLIQKLDTEDNSIAQAIAIFFL